jgi:predicted dehydrogenase
MRVLVIGSGVIAREHALAARSLFGVSLKLRIHSRNAPALARLLHELPYAVGEPDLDEALSRAPAGDEIVIIATPPVTHLALIEKALSCGRHVLCEKPLVTSAKELVRLAEVARRSTGSLGCCNTRYLAWPTTEHVRQLVSSGALGTVYHATFVERAVRHRPGIEYQPSSRWFLNGAVSGGGVVLDWAGYDFALLRSVLGFDEFQVEHAFVAKPDTGPSLPPDVTFDVETHVGASLRLRAADASAISVHYERSWDLHGDERTLVELDGTLGSVRWDWLPWTNGGKLQVSFRYSHGGTPASRVKVFDVSRELPANARPLAFFTRAIRGDASPALVGRAALFNAACTLSLYESAHSRRAVRVAMSESLP